jgi:enediyne biosynthesis protein E4
MRRRLLAAVLGGAALALAWAAWWAIDAWRFRSDLGRARREVASGQLGPALARLTRLARRWPGRGDVESLLGQCEAAAGHLDAALSAWGRVPPDAPEAPRVELQRAELALKHGRLAVAEESLGRALRRGGAVADQARESLRLVLWLTGRVEEWRLLAQEGWPRERDRLGVLRDLARLDTEPYPIEAIRAALERARRVAPDDDRVWLGWADLAARLGRLDEADAWLRRCEARRPADPAVARARLDWALAADRPDLAAPALRHLPASRLSPTRILSLRAWLAAHAGDAEAERAALTELIAQDPGDTSALERLADLAAQAGRADRVASLRRRKAELDRARERYRLLLAAPDLSPHFAELARTAETLGRRFEARGWWTLQARLADDPDARAALARLGRDKGPPALPDTPVADLLPGLAPLSRASRSPQARSATFTDDAEAAGLRFIFDHGPSPLRQLPETMSGGVGLLDYDGDGWLDVYALQGGPFPPDPDAPHGGDRLFRNRGDGRFEDVTQAAGLAGMVRGYGHGVAVGDYDNDGRPDLFLTRWRSYALYRNQGDGTFRDVTGPAGLGGDRDWPTSAAWADLDGDGDLDLYVCHYLAWDPQHPRICHRPDAQSNTYCNPRDFAALPDHLFRNDGGRFVDMTDQAGIVDRDGRGLGVVAADLDDDGKLDLYVANDTTANFLFRNKGGLRFEEVGESAGVAGNAAGGYQAGMGVACGDLDGDGRLDLAVTNFYGESTTFYRNLGGGLFADHTAAVGLAAPSRYRLGFGIAFLDADDDGHLDLATANGHVNDFRPNLPFAMPAQLLLGGEGGRLTDVSDRAGPPWSVSRLGRGLAAGDLDNDGRIDLLIVSQGGPLAYFHNRTRGGHWLALRLEGTASNRDAVGARVAITVGGRRQVAQRLGGGSYLSAGDGRLHFGLGPARRVDRVEVAWPSGRVDHFEGLAADAGYLLREGESQPCPLAGFGRRD